MKWEIVTPEQDDWKEQWNLTAYGGAHIVGSVVVDEEGSFYSVIDGTVEIMMSDCLEDARKEFYVSLDLFFEEEINYYTELREMLERMG